MPYLLSALLLAGLASLPSGGASRSVTRNAAGTEARARSLSGVVLDPSGAAIPGAHVLLRFEKNVPVETKTDASGSLRFDRLPTGKYDI